MIRTHLETPVRIFTSLHSEKRPQTVMRIPPLSRASWLTLSTESRHTGSASRDDFDEMILASSAAVLLDTNYGGSISQVISVAFVSKFDAAFHALGTGKVG